MILKSEFLKSLANVGGGSLFLSLGRFITIVIATRFVGTSNLGIYFLVVASAGIITSIAGFGTNVAIVKFIAEEEDVKNKILFSSVTILFFLVCLLSVIVVTIFINSVTSFVEIKLMHIWVCISYAVFFYLNYPLQGFKKFKSISLANTLNGALKIVLALTLVAFFKFGFEGLLWTVILSNTIAVLFQLHSLYNGFKITELSFSQFNFLRNLLKFSLPIYLNQIYSNFYDRGYTLLIAAMLNPAAVAYYNIAIKFSAFIDQLRQIFNSVYFPKLVELLKTHKEKAEKLLKISITIIFISLSFGAFVFFITRNQVITFLFSTEYKTVSLAAFIMVSRCVFSFCSAVMGFSLVAHGHNSAPLKINVIITSFSFITSYLCIPYYGYMGVVYIAFFCAILSFLFNYFYLNYANFFLRLGSSGWGCFIGFILVVIMAIFRLYPFMYLSFLIFLAFSIISIYGLKKEIV